MLAIVVNERGTAWVLEKEAWKGSKGHFGRANDIVVPTTCPCSDEEDKEKQRVRYIT
jgi:hypothetical protein